MVKFRTPEDKLLFLLEVGKKPGDDDTPDDHRLFIKRREKVGTLYKNFRKSRSAQLSWQRDRFKRQMASKRFAHSPEGRRLHRQLGRFLSTRIIIPKEGAYLSRQVREELIDLKKQLLDEMRFYVPLHLELFMRSIIDEISEHLDIQ